MSLLMVDLCSLSAKVLDIRFLGSPALPGVASWWPQFCCSAALIVTASLIISVAKGTECD